MKKSILVTTLAIMFISGLSYAQNIDWCNLSGPESAAIFNNDTLEVFSEIYIEGVTEIEGVNPDILALIGVSEEDTDPSEWDLWIPAYYQSTVEDNHLYKAEIHSLPAGTYYFASLFSYEGGDTVYGGYSATGGGFWDGTENVSGSFTITDILGSTCDNPFTHELPLESPLNLTNQTSCGMLNIYNQTCLGSYDVGQDVIYQLEITEAGILNIEFDPEGVIRTAIALYNTCPVSADGCIDYYYDNTADVRTLETPVVAGTYYVIVDQFPTGVNCIESFSLDIVLDTDVCLDPTNLIVSNILQEEVALHWTEGLAEEEWDVLYGDPGFNVETEGTLIENIIENPYVLSGLTEGTDYEAYIRAKCDESNYSEWTGPVSFATLVPCPPPYDIFISDITDSTVDIHWTPELTTDTWNLKIGEQGFNPEEQEEIEYIEATTANNQLFSNLTENTSYDIYIKTVCGTEFGEWIGPIEFHTECAVISTFPWTETFENTSEHRSCWTQEYVEGDLDWEFQNGAGAGQITDAFYGELNAAFYISSAQEYITKLISPTFDISEVNEPTLTFWFAQEVVEFQGDINQNELKVYYRTSHENEWILLDHFDENVDNWTKQGFSLPEPSETYQIAFEGIHNYGRDNVIDYVKIKAASDMPHIVEVDIYNEAEDITVSTGTAQFIAIEELAQHITIIDSNDAEHVVELSWTIEDYSSNTIGDYDATGSFELPGGVVQSDPPTDLAVHAIVSVWEEPKINVIDVNNDVEDIEVFYGTPQSSAISTLAQEIYVSDSHNNEYEVSLVWSIADYDSNTPEDYIATGIFALPEEVGQTDPETELKVYATVTVLEKITIEDVDVNNDVEDITVDLGTTEAAAIQILTDEITIEDSENNLHTVELIWIIQSYNANVVGEYNAIGQFNLPEGVHQSEPETDLNVNATVNVIDPNFIDSYSNDFLSIFPNPSDGKFTLIIENSSIDNAEFQIIDSKGVVVHSDIITDENVEVNLNEEAGMYFIRIIANDNVIVKKLIIK